MATYEAAKPIEFTDIINRLTRSSAYLRRCEEVCGCREYMFNMLDKEQLDYLLNRIPYTKTDTVLDLGCGNGGILRLIVEKHGCRGIGIDKVSTSKTDYSGKIRYICGDINDISVYPIEPTIALSVDGLYFGCDLHKLITSLRSMKVSRFCLFWSQYIFGGSGDVSVLQSDKTVLGAALKEAGIAYDTVDFGENEFGLYKKALSALEKYESAFVAENNLDLYEQKLRETKLGIELFEKGLASRYLYTGGF